MRVFRLHLNGIPESVLWVHDMVTDGCQRDAQSIGSLDYGGICALLLSVLTVVSVPFTCG
jgi:hypothetical protein